jgi:hypothetical protein
MDTSRSPFLRIDLLLELPMDGMRPDLLKGRLTDSARRGLLPK